MAIGGGQPPRESPPAPPGVLPAILGLLALALAAGPLAAGAFEFFHASGKGMGMAGAFAAQAEDPSAVFYNVGALAFLDKEPIVSAGFAAWNLNQSLYQGLPPGIGAGTNGEQKKIQNFTPHAYLALPLGETGKAGIGVNSPFMLDTLWNDKNTFPGRFLAVATELRTIDVTAAAAYQIGKGLAAGAGVIYRTSELSLLRRVPSFDPAAGRIVDVASFAMTATLDDGMGWTAGVMQQIGEGLTVGLSYRSPITVDYSGEARLTQIETDNAGLNALIAQTLPLDQDLSFRSRIEFPDTTTPRTGCC